MPVLPRPVSRGETFNHQAMDWGCLHLGRSATAPVTIRVSASPSGFRSIWAWTTFFSLHGSCLRVCSRWPELASSLTWPVRARRWTNFGVPARFAGFAGLALPLVELVLAVALIPVATAWWAALGALVLLLAFMAAIGYNLAQGRTPDCHCFGQLHSAPAGPRTLVRNGVLAALAAFVVAFGFSDPGSSAVSWFGDLSGPERIGLVVAILLIAAVALMGWLMNQVLLQNGRLLVRLDEIEAALANGGQVAPRPNPDSKVGQPAPAFDLPSLAGDRMTLAQLRGLGKPVLLVFSDPNCQACSLLLPDIARWQTSGSLTVALVNRGTAEANRAKIDGHQISNVLLEANREVSQAYDANVTPTAIVVRQDGAIGSDPARGSESIKALVARTMVQLRPETPTPNPSASVGKPAPSLVLPDLDGNNVSLDDYRGSDTVVLFWNPSCGFCKRMLPDLQAWTANPPEGAPKLVVVSQGSIPENQELQLQAPVLLGTGASAAFGVGGTPGAILIDRDGKIASPVAMGAPGVFALLDGNPSPALPGAT